MMETVAGRWPRLAPPVVAAALILTGTAFRVVLTLNHVPNSDGDESTMGLMALHIAQGRHLPVFFYGQHYMGSIEAILAAPAIALAGASVLALRLPVLPLVYIAFGTLMYLLASRLYSRWYAVAVTAALAPASYHVLAMQMRASGGYPELAAAGAAAVLLAVVTAGAADRSSWRHVLRFGLFGLVAGFVLWDDWLPLPYLAGSAVLLLAFCYRDLFGRCGVALVAGFLAGALPVIVKVVTGNGRAVLTEPLTIAMGAAPVP
ncbi:MAG TPA: hypothetical protein VJT31_23235, partial [Rugosimonospora sp.]|nr:hypothetical protein [Rugosimonospora sp.]